MSGTYSSLLEFQCRIWCAFEIFTLTNLREYSFYDTAFNLNHLIDCPMNSDFLIILHSRMKDYAEKA